MERGGEKKILQNTAACVVKKSSSRPPQCGATAAATDAGVRPQRTKEHVIAKQGPSCSPLTLSLPDRLVAHKPSLCQGTTTRSPCYEKESLATGLPVGYTRYGRRWGTGMEAKGEVVYTSWWCIARAWSLSRSCLIDMLPNGMITLTEQQDIRDK